MRLHIVALPLIALVIVSSPAVQAGDESTVKPETELVALRDAALADDYAYQQVAHLTDNLGPRPSGSPQAEAAVEYVAGELRRLGLEVRLEDVRVRRWMRGVDTAELTAFPGQAPGTTQKILVTALGGNTSTPAEGITAEVVVARNFAELKALGRQKVAGKIVAFNFPFDKQKASNGLAGEAYGEAVEFRAIGPKTAAEMGAVACVVRSVGGADYRLPHTGFSVPAGIPSGAVTSEDADLIARLSAQGKVIMHLTLTSQNGPEVLSHNVVADLKGSLHPEQIVIVSGHLDSWDLGTGAIDDAAGVAVAMETAQLVQELRLHPKRTIRVIAWMDEENGGRGHDAYAQAHASEIRNYVAAMESDMGASHPLGFWAKVNPQALPPLKPVQDVLQSFGANLIQVVEFSPGSDIAPLAKAGVPTLGIMQDSRTYFNYHHSAADTLDKIAPQDLRENAAAMAVMGYALANLPEPLPR
ncbi:Peptidase M28 [Candidatus Sulfotelmatobacter sp. SbA7]|jgi:carboxypeptidase Q|nr:Peptidase M28 [Candidatus Sulfotelmatobacter sp. SbA7]